MPSGTELESGPVGGMIELEDALPVPSATEVEAVGTYAMIDELSDVGSTYGGLDEVDTTTTAEVDPVPNGTEGDAGSELTGVGATTTRELEPVPNDTDADTGAELDADAPYPGIDVETMPTLPLVPMVKVLEK